MIRSTNLIFENATSVADTIVNDRLFKIVNAGTVSIELIGNAVFTAHLEVLSTYQGNNLLSDILVNGVWTSVPVVKMSDFSVINSITGAGIYNADGGVSAIKLVVDTFTSGTLTARYSEIS